MSIIGLTGDVGAGKSTLCSVWREMGARVIDADTVARSMWDRADVRAEAEKAMGRWLLRRARTKKRFGRKLRRRSSTTRRNINLASALIHKRTGEELKKLARGAEGWVIVEIPLLYEGGHDEWLDYVVYAAAPFDKRVARNAKRKLERRRGLAPRGEAAAKRGENRKSRLRADERRHGGRMEAEGARSWEKGLN